MRNMYKGVRLTARDLDLLQFLFRYKVGTIKQLAKYPFKGANYHTSRLRFNRLVKHGYLEKQLLNQYSPRRSVTLSYYSLTGKSLGIVRRETPYTMIREQKNSNHPYHDVRLVDIGEWLKSCSLVEEFIQENVLQCCEEFINSEEYMHFSRVHADGAFKLRIKDESFLLALEYESVAKSKQRIRDKLFDYLPLDGVRAVFYVCENDSIEQSIRQIEKEIFPNDLPRIYYCQFSQIPSSQGGVVFTDSHNGQFLLE